MNERSWMPVLAGGVCIAAGALFAIAVRPGAASAPAVASSPLSAASPTSAAPDRAVLEELTREVRALREALSAERAPVAVTGEQAAREALEVLRDELGVVLAQLQRHASAGVGSAASALDTSSRGPLRSSLFLRSDKADVDEELTRAHRLWTYQRVLDAYGLPDQIDGGDRGVEWCYLDSDSKRATGVRFCDGYVVEVYGDD